MNDKLYQVLVGWRQGLIARGLPTPPDVDLRAVAAEGRGWPASGLEPVTEGWRENISYLQKQVRFGVNDPVGNATADIWVPRPGLPVEPPKAGSGPTAIGLPTGAASAPSVDKPTEPPTSPAPIDPANRMMERLESFLLDKQKSAPFGHPVRQLKINRLRGQRLRPFDPRLPDIIKSYKLQDWATEITSIVFSDQKAEAAPKKPSPTKHSAQDSAESEPPAPAATVASAEVEAAVPVAPSPAAASHVPLASTFDPNAFAPYVHVVANEEPMTMQAVVTPSKSVQLSWRARPDISAPVRIYRVVANDEFSPYSPGSGRMVAATTALDVEDTEPLTGPLRHIAVWCNSGQTEAEAMRAQPYLHARETVVAPVTNFQLREDSGSVIGEWDELADERGGLPAVRCVHVYRIPAGRSGQGDGWSGYRILADEPNRTGFQDNSAERGKLWIFQAIVEVIDESGQIYLSAPDVREIRVPVVLQPVQDLVVTLDDNAIRPTFDLTWTAPPNGQVEIYRTATQPTAGIEDAATERERLAGARLDPEARLPQSRVKTLDDGRHTMREVPWPVGWTRAYFTPVTVHAGMAHVGRFVAATRVPTVADAVIVERVNQQLLSFGWPAGAAQVWVYLGARGSSAPAPGDIRQHPDYEIDRAAWDRDGGLHFLPPLPLVGCSLHLYSVAFENKAGTSTKSRPVFSAGTTVEYSGLQRIHYATSIRRAKFGGKAAGVHLVLRSDNTNNPPLDFALVCHPDRYPLCLEDGQPLPLLPVGSQEGTATYSVQCTVGDQWSEPGWVADLSGLAETSATPYFLRLFVQIPPYVATQIEQQGGDPQDALRQIALLDPPLDDLRLWRS